MPPVEVFETYGLQVDRKQAVLLKIIMEHKDQEFQDRAMTKLSDAASPEILGYILWNHPRPEMQAKAMEALEKT